MLDFIIYNFLEVNYLFLIIFKFFIIIVKDLFLKEI